MTPTPIPRIKSRLLKYLGSATEGYDRILCRILQDKEYEIQKIVIIASLSLANVKRLLNEEMSMRDYAAYAYAVSKDTVEDWLKLGMAFLHSMPQVTPEEAEYNVGFIVECMRWKE